MSKPDQIVVEFSERTMNNLMTSMVQNMNMIDPSQTLDVQGFNYDEDSLSWTMYSNLEAPLSVN